MNNYFEALFRELQLPNALVDCAMGRIELPIAGLVSPAEWFGFPPALCPIWSNASFPCYLGYWKHWFTPRPASYVTMDVESGKVKEIARTTDQFFCHAIIRAITAHDRVTPAIESFASAVGINTLAEIDRVSFKSGDDPRGYPAISYFKDGAPLSSVSDPCEYTGSFPSGIFSHSIQWWHDACLFEITEEVLGSWPTNIPMPSWLLPGNRAAAFDSFLNAGDLHAAWLTLNSPGWLISAAKEAITRLAAVADDRLFSLVAQAWKSVANDRNGSY